MDQIEASNQLISINIAINKLLRGETITSLKVGSDKFAQEFSYANINLESLTKYRSELLEIISAYSTTEQPKFSRNSCFSIEVTKRV